MTALSYALSDTLVLAKRSFLRIPRQPDLLVGFTIQPVMFVLLFVYVLGGAIQTPGFDYVDFLMPGIIVQSMAFGGFVTALGLSEDLKKGLIDRFRSLPMSRAAVLTGRTLADVATNVVQLVVMLGVGLAVGFRFSTSVPEVVAGIALVLLIGYAFSWVFAFIGLVSSSPEASNAWGFTIIFPLTFVSSAFVPVDSMPSWLQPIAEHNPVTTMVDAVRALFLGTPAGNDIWLSVLWSLGHHRRLRSAFRLALPTRGHPLTVLRHRLISTARVLRAPVPDPSITGRRSHARASSASPGGSERPGGPASRRTRGLPAGPEAGSPACPRPRRTPGPAAPAAAVGHAGAAGAGRAQLLGGA